MEDQGIEGKVVTMIMEECNYQVLGAQTDSGFWHQETGRCETCFQGGPLRLGSAVAGVNDQMGILDHLMGAAGPHWCEDPVLDRDNEAYRMAQALIRIRRSCYALRTQLDSPAPTGEGRATQLAYWKLHDGREDPRTGEQRRSEWAQLRPRSSGRDEDMAIEEQPLGMLVVLSMIPSLEDQPDQPERKYLLPEGLEYNEGQEFVDLLHPTRTGTIVAEANGSFLLLPAELEDVHVAIFAPVETAAQDVGGWMVCRGVELAPMRDTCSETARSEARKPRAQEMWITAGLVMAWIALAVLILAWNYRTKIYLSIVKDHHKRLLCSETGVDGLCVQEPTLPNIMRISGPRVEPKHVIVAAIEHTIPERGVKVSAGGLGKVLDQMLREHPQCTMSLVHPMFGDVNYGELEEFDKLACLVDGKEQTITVWTMQSELNGLKRVWYILEHEYFTEKVKSSPYPPSMTKVRTLRYFSLWNQATAMLIRRLKPDIYHCMDYHAALAPLYLEASEQIPIILVLHNADYMGDPWLCAPCCEKTVTQLRRLSLIFNLKVSVVRRYCMFEGRFNMLKAGVTYIKQTQAGYGICAVSENYAVELKRERTLFAGLPYLISLDNATDPAEVEDSIDRLKTLRSEAKAQLQKHCGLEQEPGAKILIFIGRWVKQKGVDHIAMLTPAFLRSHPEVQIILAGPPDDACGLYAGTLLEQLGDDFKGRLFVCTQFFRLPEELRRGAHLCFTPSCSEPFGYVDVEFGLLGVPSVGAAIGGLGKMPGVYFRQQNSDDSKTLIDSFFCSVDYALNLPDPVYWEMALNATKAEFPFETWRANLLGSYSKAITNFSSYSNSESNLLFDVPSPPAAQDVVRDTMAPRRPTALRRMSSTAQVAHKMRVLDIDGDAEFLTQPVSDDRTHELMKWEFLQSAKAGHCKVKDSEQLQSQICQADERLTERSHVTQWLMKPFARGLCLRIHLVIALGYIFSPVGETLLKSMDVRARSNTFASEHALWITFYLGAGCGCLFWLFLSRGVPPNLLMASSQLLNIVFFVVVLAWRVFLHIPLRHFDLFGALWLAEHFTLALHRLELQRGDDDFHGGFQVAAKRIGALESLRCGVGWVAVNLSYAGLEFINRNVVLVVSLGTTVLLFKAPQCYASYVLPSTGLLEGMTHKSFILLVIAEILNMLVAYPSQTYTLWWTLNGWEPGEIANFALLTGLMAPILLIFCFSLLARMTLGSDRANQEGSFSFGCLRVRGNERGVAWFGDAPLSGRSSW
eukprot:g20263.t1